MTGCLARRGRTAAASPAAPKSATRSQPGVPRPHPRGTALTCLSSLEAGAPVPTPPMPAAAIHGSQNPLRSSQTTPGSRGVFAARRQQRMRIHRQIDASITLRGIARKAESIEDEVDYASSRVPGRPSFVGGSYLRKATGRFRPYHRQSGFERSARFRLGPMRESRWLFPRNSFCPDFSRCRRESPEAPFT